MKQMRIGTSHASTCIFIYKNRITILLQTQTYVTSIIPF